MICHFPEVFKPVFVFSGKVTSLDVFKVLYPRPSENEMNGTTKCVWKYGTTFIEAANSDGNTELVQHVYKIFLMFIFI